jgi:hypothetical protein
MYLISNKPLTVCLEDFLELMQKYNIYVKYRNIIAEKNNTTKIKVAYILTETIPITINIRQGDD